MSRAGVFSRMDRNRAAAPGVLRCRGVRSAERSWFLVSCSRSDVLRAVCAVLVQTGCTQDAAPPGAVAPPPVPVEAYPVEPRPLVRTIDAVGTFRSPRSTEIAAEVAGRLTFLDVPEGRRVKKGHVLARLDARVSTAELAVARARLESARDTLDRTRTLEQEQLVPRHSVDDAQNAASVARSEVARQHAGVQQTVIVAPFDGLVGIREVSPGAYVMPGTPITRLTSIDELELVFSVPERHVPSLAVGQSVRGMVGACTHRFTGQIVVLEPAVDPATRTLRALARIDPSGALRPGMSASLKVEVEKVEQAVAVPLEAIVRRGTQQLIYALTPEQTVERRLVRTGDIDVRFIEIVDGVRPGDRVITSGQQKVGPGTRVEPSAWQPIENPNLALGTVGEEADCWF
jgi:membrane fusion protein, multidrug efflux system